MNSTFVVLDIETTGLSPYTHAITEIAAQKISRGEVVEQFQSLINPQTKIPRFITQLTGITDEMVQDAPLIKDVLLELKEFLADHPVVAHNASFDYKFLAYNFKIHHNYDMINQKICTRKLATRLLPDLPSKKLSSLCEFYGLVNEASHTAMGDTQVTTKIFTNFCEDLKTAGCKHATQIEFFANAPTYKARRLLNEGF
ncbi:MAG: PolC-type DNA polymerase III [Candidatus Woesearchaeota archaeon]